MRSFTLPSASRAAVSPRSTVAPAPVTDSYAEDLAGDLTPESTEPWIQAAYGTASVSGRGTRMCPQQAAI